MQQSSSILFVSSNDNKVREARKILSKFGINVLHYDAKIREIQENSLSKIASQKVLDAYEEQSNVHKGTGSPIGVIVEDDGLFIDSLGGFPGPYSSYAYDTIGNKGIMNLLQNSEHRDAKFVAIIAYYLRGDEVKLFESSIPGKISKEIEKGGWGYDPIFIPDGESKTYANVSDKDKVSHRSAALTKFSNWFLDKQKDNGQ
jgi:XTP/dITP diphosphohydrolase